MADGRDTMRNRIVWSRAFQPKEMLFARFLNGVKFAKKGGSTPMYQFESFLARLKADVARQQGLGMIHK
jgi:hypothetical protein